MSVQAVITVLDRLIAENRAVFHDDASVAVQFAAGEWNKLKAAVEGAKAELTAPTPVSDPAPALDTPVVGQ